MKTLFILRHAKSSRDDPSLRDHDRPLNDRGKRDAPRIGLFMKEHGLIPEFILSSTANRASKTARKVIEAGGFKGTYQESDDLYDAAPGTCIQLLQQIPNQYQSAMIIGHNPCMEELLQYFTREYKRFPTAALAQVELPLKSWKEIKLSSRGQLIRLCLPKELE